MTTLTAAGVHHAALEPSLDAQAHNATQARLIDHPDTSEADSIVEHVDCAMRHMRRAMHLLGGLARSNGLELRCEQMIAGWGDDLVTTLRDQERNGDGVESGRALAYRLKPIIDSLDSDEFARGELYATFITTPASVLLARSVTHQLAARRTERLRTEYERWCLRAGRAVAA